MYGNVGVDEDEDEEDDVNGDEGSDECLSTVGIQGLRRFVHAKRDVAESVIELKGRST